MKAFYLLILALVFIFGYVLPFTKVSQGGFLASLTSLGALVLFGFLISQLAKVRRLQRGKY